jgi:hypothetical protein
MSEHVWRGRRGRATVVAGLVLGLLAVAPGGAARAADESGASGGSGLFDYRPPDRGAPAARLGGASRGTEAAPALEVLLPDHVAETASAQPALSWFVSRPVAHPVEITLMADTADTPRLSTRLAPPLKAGLHTLDLARHGVSLPPGVVHDWSVAIIRDPAQRSLDVFARGALKHVAPPPGLAPDALAGRPPAQAAAELAQAGLWVDALAALRDAVAAGTVPRAALADSLAQQGLTHAAAFLRGGG